MRFQRFILFDLVVLAMTGFPNFKNGGLYYNDDTSLEDMASLILVTVTWGFESLGMSSFFFLSSLSCPAPSITPTPELRADTTDSCAIVCCGVVGVGLFVGGSSHRNVDIELAN